MLLLQMLGNYMDYQRLLFMTKIRSLWTIIEKEGARTRCKLGVHEKCPKQRNIYIQCVSQSNGEREMK